MAPTDAEPRSRGGMHANPMGGKIIPEIARVYRTLGPEILEDLKEAHYRKIALQVPAGLTRNALAQAADIRRATGSEVVVINRACFGACDPPSPDESVGAEALVALGHSPIPNMPLALPTYFVEMRTDEGRVDALADLVKAAGLPRRLGLVSSIQHLDLIGPFRSALASRGITLTTGEGDRRLAYGGQALGCNYTSAESIADKIDGILFLGTGLFHPLGLALAVDRPVWSLDPLREHLEPPLDRQAMVNKRLLQIARAGDARRWGVLISSFVGQNRQGMAASLIERARARGREAEAITFGRLDPRDLLGRDLDAYVCTACPRLALDDGDQFERPILTAPEFLAALGDRPLVPYQFDTYH